MISITRDPAEAAKHPYDLIVVGGGILGAFAALEAARRGARALLIERDDFGGGASAAVLRIVHGGLRCLQSMDFAGALCMAREQAWFLRHMPHLVTPLPCVMPLYGPGLRRPLPVGAAMALHCRMRPSASRLKRSRMLGRSEAIARHAWARPDGLLGAGEWWDALMRSPGRIVTEIVRSACDLGAAALGRVEARSLLTDGSRVRGVQAADTLTGRELAFESPVVLDCAALWPVGQAPASSRTLAFNLLLGAPAFSDGAAGVTSPDRSQTYFLVPLHGKVLAGTGYRATGEPRPQPTPADVAAMLNGVRAAAPILGDAGVLSVMAGTLPSDRKDSEQPLGHDTVVDHGRRDGPRGLFSGSCVKFTTARAAAMRLLRTAMPSLRKPDSRYRMPDPAPRLLLDPVAAAQAPDDALLAAASHAIRHEAVLSLEDLMHRRSEWGLLPDLAEPISDRLHRLLDGRLPASAHAEALSMQVPREGAA